MILEAILSQQIQQDQVSVHIEMKPVIQQDASATIGSSVGSISSSAQVTNAIQQSPLQDAVRDFRQIFKSDNMLFDWHPENIDVSDNAEQVQVIKHHYTNELGRERSLDELLKDYREDSVIYEVIDDKPATYRGRDGVRKAVKDLFALLHVGDNEDELPIVDLQHIKVKEKITLKSFGKPGHQTIRQSLEQIPSRLMKTIVSSHNRSWHCLSGKIWSIIINLDGEFTNSDKQASGLLLF